ncbi:MAG TPA: molecular chaperone DnaJ [Candidatus Thermoplasmatota archaeon]|nr:molecular chaperone DnaJ [Candidatus Thermoplasmatota archaeon]
MPTRRDYYEVLGLPREASKDDIKKVYRKLAMQYHPDRNKEPGAEEKFKEISEAYAVLSDDEKRRVYDQMGHAGFDERYSDEDIFRGADFGEMGFDLGDILRMFFGGGGGFGGGPRRGRDLQYQLPLSLEEAAFGVEKKIRIPRLEPCDTCNGTGGEGGRTKACGTCGGAGQVRQVVRTPFGVMQQVGACPQCRGRGRTFETPCKRCRGAGRVEAERTLTVKVPPGVDTGTNLRMRGEGEAGPEGAPSGDLYITVRVDSHPLFERDGEDLHVRAPLTFAQAALGDEILVPTLDGKETPLRVPSGTQTNTVFRVRGQGMPTLRGNRGDLHVHVVVRTPEKLTSEEREVFERLRELEGKGGKKGFFGRLF